MIKHALIAKLTPMCWFGLFTIFEMALDPVGQTICADACVLSLLCQKVDLLCLPWPKLWVAGPKPKGKRNGVLLNVSMLSTALAHFSFLQNKVCAHPLSQITARVCVMSWPLLSTVAKTSLMECALWNPILDVTSLIVVLTSSDDVKLVPVIIRISCAFAFRRAIEGRPW